MIKDFLTPQRLLKGIKELHPQQEKQAKRLQIDQLDMIVECAVDRTIVYSTKVESAWINVEKVYQR